VLEFDTVGECRFEGESTVDDRCQQDEAAALEQLRAGWTQFVVADKSTCLAAATCGFAKLCRIAVLSGNGGAMSTTATVIRAVRKRQKRCDNKPPE